MKFIVAYVEVGASRISKSTFVSQLNGNPTLPNDRLTWIKAGNSYMKPKLFSATNHVTILDLGYDYGVSF